MRRPGRPPYPGTLTPRQQEVLDLVRQGQTNEQIGRQLGISTEGARFHVKEILGRLGVPNRREAAGWQPEREAAPTAVLGTWRRSRSAGRRDSQRCSRRRPLEALA